MRTRTLNNPALLTLLALPALPFAAGSVQAQTQPANKAQSPAPWPSQPPPNSLLQLDSDLKALARQAKPCVVAIQSQPHMMILPVIPPRLTPQERAQLTPEKQKAYDTEQADAEANVAAFIETARLFMRSPITGSGFLIPGGFIVTTAELVERMDNPDVIFPDGRHARVEWKNPDTQANIAVLKIADTSLDAGMTWGDSGNVEAASLAISIYSQGDFPQSVTLGIISAIGCAGKSGTRRYENLIQFQGAVSASSSGGPLLDAKGELIGMIVATPRDPAAELSRIKLQKPGQKEPSANSHTSPALPFSGLSNTGFALASNDMRPIVERLCRQEKRPAPGYIGVYLPHTEAPQEARVERVLEGSPAAKAGLQEGDVILAISGQAVRTAAEFRSFASNVASGLALRLTIRRGGETKIIPLKTEPRPAPDPQRKHHPRQKGEKTGLVLCRFYKV